MAPEVLRQNLYSKSADVYSFGILLWELTSCRIPFLMNVKTFTLFMILLMVEDPK
jgi:serine/threonine protein kinase